ncbi:MAG: four-helix bundle copper-binding protein [Phenylobacterium sp.]|uniref:four-helix bundle copper-binding protein n=1 Tax=Phenylobacterium sp. TaxID=1871053 RepID=UPI00272215B8|nr:four-helix bundle copper-binding protein [Phenylobacterium sp.]MDO8410932.1 four-helix bundle copper-binding protein [Phenylobacterium sp.]
MEMQVRDRRELLAVLTLAGAAAAMPAAAQAPPSGDGHGMSMDDCVALCIASHRSCLTSARHVIEQPGLRAPAQFVALLQDCAELCQTTANSMLRGAPTHTLLCSACADLCAACAQACDAFKGDAVLTRCAATCRECGAACRHMAMAM